jgi:hypothetical protein
MWIRACLDGFSDVTIMGTGTTHEPLRDVDRPIAFRNGVTAQ